MPSGTTAHSSSTPEIKVIAPGFVLLKGVLDKDKQIWLANYAIQAGEVPNRGFYITKEDGSRMLNSDTGRGRIYDTIETFPEPTEIRQLCNTLVSTAQKNDNKMPDMQPTHLLLLMYANSEGMYWHKDCDPNDGDNDHPIVSLTVGNSCDFGYKLVGREEQFIRLDSGDVVIWGGPNRMLLHSVAKVHMNTSPDFLPLQNVRLNFTYRDAPNILGEEYKFKYNVDSQYNLAIPTTYLQQPTTPNNDQHTN